jgi:hypothetical protein
MKDVEKVWILEQKNGGGSGMKGRRGAAVREETDQSTVQEEKELLDQLLDGFFDG